MLSEKFKKDCENSLCSQKLLLIFSSVSSHNAQCVSLCRRAEKPEWKTCEWWEKAVYSLGVWCYCLVLGDQDILVSQPWSHLPECWWLQAYGTLWLPGSSTSLEEGVLKNDRLTKHLRSSQGWLLLRPLHFVLQQQRTNGRLLRTIVFLKTRRARVEFPPGDKPQICAGSMLAHQELRLCLGRLEMNKQTVAIAYVSTPVLCFWNLHWSYQCI